MAKAASIPLDDISSVTFHMLILQPDTTFKCSWAIFFSAWLRTKEYKSLRQRIKPSYQCHYWQWTTVIERDALKSADNQQETEQIFTHWYLINSSAASFSGSSPSFPSYDFLWRRIEDGLLRVACKGNWHTWPSLNILRSREQAATTGNTRHRCFVFNLEKKKKRARERAHSDWDRRSLMGARLLITI